MLKRAAVKTLDLLFPPRCQWCGGVVSRQNGCAACGAAVTKLRLPDTPLASGLNEAPPFTAAYAVFSYDEPVRSALVRFKFEGEKELCKPLGEILYEKFSKLNLKNNIDIIVPAPASPATLKKRGYNQSLLLAQTLAQKAGLPFAGGALVKTIDTTPQMMLTREERLTNLKDAFTAEGHEIDGKRVLLADDIFTTGSTANECTKALMLGGAKSCTVLCVAASLAVSAR